MRPQALLRACFAAALAILPCSALAAPPGPTTALSTGVSTGATPRFVQATATAQHPLLYRVTPARVGSTPLVARGGASLPPTFGADAFKLLANARSKGDAAVTASKAAYAQTRSFSNNTNYTDEMLSVSAQSTHDDAQKANRAAGRAWGKAATALRAASAEAAGKDDGVAHSLGVAADHADRAAMSHKTLAAAHDAVADAHSDAYHAAYPHSMLVGGGTMVHTETTRNLPGALAATNRALDTNGSIRREAKTAATAGEQGFSTAETAKKALIPRVEAAR